MFVEDIIKFKKLGLGGDTPTPPTPSEPSEGIAKVKEIQVNINYTIEHKQGE